MHRACHSLSACVFDEGRKVFATICPGTTKRHISFFEGIPITNRTACKAVCGPVHVLEAILAKICQDSHVWINNEGQDFGPVSCSARELLTYYLPPNPMLSPTMYLKLFGLP
jgi:hypothetical protein